MQFNDQIQINNNNSVLNKLNDNYKLENEILVNNNDILSLYNDDKSLNNNDEKYE